MCTSFVSYYNQPLYGMNFAFWDIPMKLRIYKEKNTKIFSFDIFLGEKWVVDMVMNEHGLFGNFQGNISDTHLFIQPGPPQIPIAELFDIMTRDAKTINDVRNIIGNKLVAHNTLEPDSEFNKLHNMIADKYGNAIIIESKNYQNDIIEIDGKFMAMTNFPNGKYRGVPFQEINDYGSDRYQQICEYILKNKRQFDINKAFEALKITIQLDEKWETFISAVFDPIKLEIFLVIKRSFEKIWRVDLMSGSLETYLGFKNPIKFDLNSTEVLISDLERTNKNS